MHAHPHGIISNSCATDDGQRGGVVELEESVCMHTHME